MFRQPALGLAEVAWRWTSTLVACLLLCFLFVEYLDSLSVTKGDLFVLHSGVPWLVLGTIQHILLSGAPRFLVAAAIALLAICIVWAFAASVGRAATVNVLLDHFHGEHASETSGIMATPSRRSTSMQNARAASLLSRPLTLLHLLRAFLIVAALFAFVGAALVAGFSDSVRDPHPGIAFLLFLVLTWLIGSFWYTLNWLLSIAPIFVVRDGEGTFGAISAALRFLCERFGAVARTITIFAVVHVLIFFAASSIASAPLAVARILSPGAIIVSLVVVTLVYFVLIDFLKVARLAAYICIADTQDRVQPAAAEY